MKIRDRIKELRRVKASELHPNPKNWRTHPKQQLDALRGVLAEVGFAGAELARELPDGSLQLIDGHARAEIAGDAEIPVLILDVTESEADKILATFDPLGAMAEADAGKLEELLREVQTGSEALAEMLAELAEDNGILDSLGDAEVVEDEAPEPPVDPITKAGDLWVLGDHRLLCGDSTKTEDVERLMDGAKADLCFTDPPYNIASENKGVAADVSKAHRNLMDSDWDKGFDFKSVADRLLDCMAESATVYVCTSHHLASSIWDWMKQWSSHNSWCVWSKPNPMPSLMKRHWTWNAELICYATRGRHTFNFPAEGHSLSVWEINKVNGKSGHPTEKPVAVPAHAISHSSSLGHLCVDLFLGSGSTLIAAEQLGRKCYGMEISPQYCDVIVKRWENLTGKKAVLDNGHS